jgi:hypothetical protein
LQRKLLATIGISLSLCCVRWGWLRRPEQSRVSQDVDALVFFTLVSL